MKRNTQRLVIVESPAKARTVARIVGPGYDVRASVGHIRDLPKSSLGVDVEHDFTPQYVVPREKLKVVSELKKAATQAADVYLATDPDREGEAISWHLMQAMGLKEDDVHRVVFHELTPQAVRAAFEHPGRLNHQLVEAQQARRILDRLVGYNLSPLLWRKVKRGLSAGRVQSAALKMVVEREKAIQTFVTVEYWSIEAVLAKLISGGGLKSALQPAESFAATLAGEYGHRGKIELHTEAEAEALRELLSGASYSVDKVDRRVQARRPPPAFTTSTLQQEASRKLRFDARRTMRVAQELYEGLALGDQGEVGLITYMRTDSVRVAETAVAEARDLIAQRFGREYVPPRARVYRTSTKGAQEAHEAIRPTSVARHPDAMRAHLSRDQFRLYELIWQRMVASQMAEAQVERSTADIRAQSPSSKAAYRFRAAGSRIQFPGFLALYREGRDDAEEEDGEPLPPLEVGEGLGLAELKALQHFTQPPPRYTEASLIKALEGEGIGRPSTYAAIVSTIQERDYVEKRERRLHALPLGIVVNDLLEEHFPDIVDLRFTARMEDELDDIARGERQMVPVLQHFYLPFAASLEQAASQMERVTIPPQPTDEVCPECGLPLVIRSGRYGRFLACSGYPKCRHTSPLGVAANVACPQCGGALVERHARRRRSTFFGCSNYPTCNFTVSTRPLERPCPQCGGLLVQAGQAGARCIACGSRWTELPAEEEPVAAAMGVG